MIWLCFPLFLPLWSCKEGPPATLAKEDAPPKKISYSAELRPLLIENCLSCHQDFPLHDPKKWDLLHSHQGGTKTPDLLKRWIQEGGEIDPHWALLPLREVAGNSVDDFIEQSSQLKKDRQIPQTMFTAPVTDLLAGDLMEDHSRTVSTGYLRRGEDSPEWRAEMVAREFLGVEIGCARCHDHPSENWTHQRYQNLANLFTTPYDHLPKTLSPLYVKFSDEASLQISALHKELASALAPTLPVEKDYLDWLALDEGPPSLSGLVAAYSFEGHKLHNLALGGQVKAEGQGLITGPGAHGEGLLFKESSELILSGLPMTTELDPFTISAWIKLDTDALKKTSLLRIGTSERGFELRITEGKLNARWTKFWPQIAISTTSKFPLIVQDRWSHIAVTYDGTRLVSGLKIYLNGLPIEVIEGPQRLMKSVLAGGEPLSISGGNLSLDELQIYQQSLGPLAIKQVFDGRSLTLAHQGGTDLREFYQNHFSKETHRRQTRVREINTALLQLENDLPTYLVMANNPKSEGALDAGQAANRLDFAKTLNQDLLARSLANQVWRRHFGHGLAHSLGLSAPLPAHGDLLEWLAGKLRKSDFNLSQLGELIRHSKAWKQEWSEPEFKETICPRPEQ